MYDKLKPTYKGGNVKYSNELNSSKFKKALIKTDDFINRRGTTTYKLTRSLIPFKKTKLKVIHHQTGHFKKTTIIGTVNHRKSLSAIDRKLKKNGYTKIGNFTFHRNINGKMNISNGKGIDLKNLSNKDVIKFLNRNDNDIGIKAFISSINKPSLLDKGISSTAKNFNNTSIKSSKQLISQGYSQFKKAFNESDDFSAKAVQSLSTANKTMKTSKSTVKATKTSYKISKNVISTSTRTLWNAGKVTGKMAVKGIRTTKSVSQGAWRGQLNIQKKMISKANKKIAKGATNKISGAVTKVLVNSIKSSPAVLGGAFLILIIVMLNMMLLSTVTVIMSGTYTMEDFSLSEICNYVSEFDTNYNNALQNKDFNKLKSLPITTLSSNTYQETGTYTDEYGNVYPVVGDVWDSSTIHDWIIPNDKIHTVYSKYKGYLDYSAIKYPDLEVLNYDENGSYVMGIKNDINTLWNKTYKLNMVVSQYSDTSNPIQIEIPNYIEVPVYINEDETFVYTENLRINNQMQQTEYTFNKRYEKITFNNDIELKYFIKNDELVAKTNITLYNYLLTGYCNYNNQDIYIVTSELKSDPTVTKNYYILGSSDIFINNLINEGKIPISYTIEQDGTKMVTTSYYHNKYSCSIEMINYPFEDYLKVNYETLFQVSDDEAVFYQANNAEYYSQKYPDKTLDEKEIIAKSDLYEERLALYETLSEVNGMEARQFLNSPFDDKIIGISQRYGWNNEYTLIECSPGWNVYAPLGGILYPYDSETIIIDDGKQYTVKLLFEDIEFAVSVNDLPNVSGGQYLGKTKGNKLKIEFGSYPYEDVLNNYPLDFSLYLSDKYKTSDSINLDDRSKEIQSFIATADKYLDCPWKGNGYSHYGFSEGGFVSYTAKTSGLISSDISNYNNLNTMFNTLKSNGKTFTSTSLALSGDLIFFKKDENIFGVGIIVDKTNNMMISCTKNGTVQYINYNKGDYATASKFYVHTYIL